MINDGFDDSHLNKNKNKKACLHHPQQQNDLSWNIDGGVE